MSTTPLFRYTPKFCFWQFILPKLPIALFALLWGTGMIGGFSTVFFSQTVIKTNPFLQSFVIVPLLIVAILILTTIVLILRLESKRFDQTKFLFFKDELTWTSKGITDQQGSVLYKDIITIEVTTDMIQSQYGVSDVRLSFRSGDSASKNPFNLITEVQRGSHINLFNLPNAQEAYEQVTKLVNDHKKNLS